MPELTGDLLDLFRPPQAYAFRRGVVLTHNCSWEYVTDSIAPALAGCEDRSALTRRRFAQGTPGMKLLVAADGRESAGGPAHTWARLIRVGGRRQHSKVGLLEFVSERGRRKVRGFVTSANLTHSGMTSNYEVVVVEEQDARSRRKSIVADIATMLTAFAADVDAPPPHASDLRKTLRQIRGGLSAQPTKSMAHSLVRSVHLVDALGPSRPADRVVIVSPAFAAESDDRAAAALSPWIGAATSIDLITQPGSDGVLRFSQAAIGELRRLASAPNVSVHSVPIDPDDGTAGTQRRLHAKLLAVVHGDRARVLVGSANFTAPGLLGANREVMALLQLSSRDLDQFLDELPHRRHRGPIGRPPPMEHDHGVQLPQVVAHFEPDPTLPVDPSNLIGRLYIEAADLEVRAVVYDGHDLSGWRTHPVAIRDDVGVVTVIVDQGGTEVAVQVPIELRLTDEQLADWPTGDRTEPLTELERLLGTIRVTARSSLEPSTATAAAGVPDIDDKFVIPLEQRLVLLARYRQQIAPIFLAYWHSDRDRLAKLLEPHELRLARSLFGLDPDEPSQLLSSLADAAERLHSLRDNQ